MNVFAVRGATTLDADAEQEIVAKTTELFDSIVAANGLGADATPISLIISSTKDVTAFYPARAVRESGQTDLPLFSAQEPDIVGGLPLCIRMLLLVSSSDEKRKAKHVYLHGAASLRPDLKKIKGELTK